MINMINMIGAMHAALRTTQKRPEEDINFRVETKRSRRARNPGDEDEFEDPSQRRQSARGVSA
ncbi:MAG: hypothetical protein K2P70_07640 [Hyphomonadaceae bacterium]|nr:hypothetical protein [Hyphomonadaceae bacterium]